MGTPCQRFRVGDQGDDASAWRSRRAPPPVSASCARAPRPPPSRPAIGRLLRPHARVGSLRAVAVVGRDSVGWRDAGRIMVDIAPLRESRAFRLLFLAGSSPPRESAHRVAVPFQVYDLTRSSFQVGLVSLAQLVPLIVGSLIGGSVGDAVDRRKILAFTGILLGFTSAALALNSLAGTPALGALRGAGPGGRAQRLLGAGAHRRHPAAAPRPAPRRRVLVLPDGLPGRRRGRPGGRGRADQLRRGPLGLRHRCVHLRLHRPALCGDGAAAADAGHPSARGRVDHGRAPLHPWAPGHPGRLLGGHQRHGVRHAARPVSGAVHLGLPRGATTLGYLYAAPVPARSSVRRPPVG